MRLTALCEQPQMHWAAFEKNSREFIPVLERLLKVGRPEWQMPDRRDWTPYDQVRINAAMVFTRLGKDAAPAEALLLDTLSDPSGHVAAFALEALRRIGTHPRQWMASWNIS